MPYQASNDNNISDATSSNKSDKANNNAGHNNSVQLDLQFIKARAKQIKRLEHACMVFKNLEKQYQDDTRFNYKGFVIVQLADLVMSSGVAVLFYKTIIPNMEWSIYAGIASYIITGGDHIRRKINEFETGLLKMKFNTLMLPEGEEKNMFRKFNTAVSGTLHMERAAKSVVNFKKNPKKIADYKRAYRHAAKGLKLLDVPAQETSTTLQGIKNFHFPAPGSYLKNFEQECNSIKARISSLKHC